MAAPAVRLMAPPRITPKAFAVEGVDRACRDIARSRQTHWPTTVDRAAGCDVPHTDAGRCRSRPRRSKRCAPLRLRHVSGCYSNACAQNECRLRGQRGLKSGSAAGIFAGVSGFVIAMLPPVISAASRHFECRTRVITRCDIPG